MIRSIKDINISGKNVLLRLDLNVPLSSDEHPEIKDSTRIDEALPTIRYCLDKGARPIVCSHLGRPGGQSDPRLSLEPVGAYLAKRLEREVILLDEIIDDGVHQLVKHGSGKEIILLQNLRFHPGEERCAEEFVHQLVSLADVYVNDAFGTCHRKHASTYGVPMHMKDCGVGLLVQKELKFLDRVVKDPKQPFVLVIGGAKVTDKLKAVENLINHVDRILVGGAMAYAFLRAQGRDIGVSKCESKGVPAAKSILEKATAHGVQVLLPVDHMVAYPEKDPEFSNPTVVSQINIPEGAAGLDIGPETITKFSEAIGSAKTVFWNGPMGLFEREAFSTGTTAIAAAICKSSGVKVAGGGDTISAINSYGDPKKFDLLSTGGGASLRYLEGEGLPCISILDKHEVGRQGQSTTEPLNPDE